MTITTIQPTTQSPKWYDSKLAPCLIQNPSEFESKHHFASELKNLKCTGPIYFKIINSAHNDLWNGIGTSWVVEILHMSLINPETSTNTVFSSGILKKKFLSGINSFFEITKSPLYLQ